MGKKQVLRVSKVDYVNNNLLESFNNWIKKFKSLHVVDLMDKLGELIMRKFEHKRRVGEKMTTKIVPIIIKKLTVLSRTLGKYEPIRSTNETCAISSRDPKGNIVNDVVNIETKTCTCRQWQLTDKPCSHALGFICSLRDYGLETYVHDYFTLERFNVAYDGIIYPMKNKGKWPPVDPAYKLQLFVIRRQPGRPRNQMIKGAEEPRVRKDKNAKGVDNWAITGQTVSMTNQKEESNDHVAPKPPPAKKTPRKILVDHRVLLHPRLGQPRTTRVSSGHPIP